MGKRKSEPAIHVTVVVRSRGGDSSTVAQVDLDIVKRTGQKRFVKRLRDVADRIEQLLELKTKPKTERVYVGRRRSPPRRRPTAMVN